MTEQRVNAPMGGDEVDEPIDAQQLRLLEALLFAATEPMSERQLSARLPDGAPLKRLLAALRADYGGRGVNLVRAGDSWALRTAPDLAQLLSQEAARARKLGRAAVEVLAIAAYHQPVTRAEIEEIRGVSLSKGTLDTLFEFGWIKPRGRRKTPGQPMQWGTTDEFLDHFGLETLRDLPGVKELKAAGLLDSRPAIDSYQVRGELAAAKGADDLDQPTEIGEDLDEPLDPDDGALVDD